MSNDPRVLVLEEMRKQTALLERILAAVSGQQAAAVPDSVLDGPHGDPVVKAKDPRDWSGEPMTGKRFSECPPAYLDLLAERYDYFASKAERARTDADGDDELRKAEKDLKYATLDAKRARGWAARLRSGWTPPAPAPKDAFAAGAEPAW